MGKMFSQFFASFETMFRAWNILMEMILDLATWGGGKARTARIEGGIEDEEAIDDLTARVAARKAERLAITVTPTTTV